MVRNRDNILRRIDWLTVVLVLVIMVCGWFSITGSSAGEFSSELLSFSSRSGKQLVWIGFSLLLAAVVISITQLFYNTYSYFIYAAFMLLLLVTIFIASDHKGSHSWLDLGPVSFQPAEFAKFATALALARYVDRYDFNPKDLKDVAGAAALFLIPMFLIVCQNETGSALVYVAFLLVLYREGLTGMVLLAGACAVVFFIVAVKYGQSVPDSQFFNIGTFVVLLVIQILVPLYAFSLKNDRKILLRLMSIQFFGTAFGLLFTTKVIPFKLTNLQILLISVMILWLVIASFKDMARKYLFAAAFGLCSILYLFSVDFVYDKVFQDHQRTRINVILGLEDDPLRAGYNVNQSMIAIGSGGFWGKGFLKGTQTKLKYVPEQDTDFIFCTVGEEQGFVGSAFVLLLYLGLILRLIYLAERQPSVFGRVFGYCVLCILLFHVFVNIGMVLGITPVIGIPLPFFSYGGSSLWGFTILVSIFLRIDSERIADY